MINPINANHLYTPILARLIVQGKIEYSCPATRECEINKRRRKACQACRFQKCLNMGMLKEGVRLDRVRGGRQKYRRGLSPGPCSAGGNASVGMGGIGGVNIGINAGIGGSNSGGLNSGNVGSSGLQHANLGSLSTLSSVGSSNLGTNETSRILTALINCEPEELTASPSQYAATIPSSLSIQIKTLYILSDLFDRELVSLIGWAKQIPGFSETITLNDQMRLLQSTWAEVIALSIGYRSHLKRMENNSRQQHGGSGHHSSFMTTTPSPTSSSPASTASSYNNLNNNGNTSSPYNLENTEIRLVFAKDLIIDFKHAVACGAEEIFYNCVQLIKRLDYLKITAKEYIILKAISLTNADVRLENPKATHQLRDLIMDTLYEATLIDQLTNNNNNNNININSASTSNNNNVCSQKDDNGNNISISGNHLVKTEAQEQPLSSMNQYASTSPPRPSSSIPSSSSLSSVSSHNNNNSNNNNLGILDIGNLASKKTVINYRLNQLLLCLPVLRQIDSCIRKFWNDVRKGSNSVPMNKLFEEMLEPCQRIYKTSSEM